MSDFEWYVIGAIVGAVMTQFYLRITGKLK